MCISGTFYGSQINWSVIEKEAFPIATACDKLDYLLFRSKPFRLYCDHRNLIHVFAPNRTIPKHIRGKLLRWALKISNCNYIIEHIDGTNNVWADMVSRWAANRPVVNRTKANHAKQAIPVNMKTIRLRPLDDENFVWPSFQEIATAQMKYTPPSHAIRASDEIFRLDNHIWIPPQARDLILRICIVAHCGSNGHCKDVD